MRSAQHARRPGAHANDWTPEELDALKAHYGSSMTRVELGALLPARSWRAIVGKASELRLARGHLWTAAEEALVRTHYPTESAKGLAKRVQRFTPAQIRQKAFLLGIRATRPPGPPKGSTLSVPRTRNGPTARERRAAEARERRLQKLLAPPPKVAKAAKEKPQAKPLPMPGVQDNARTPILNAAKAARLATERQEKQVRALSQIVSVAELKAVDYSHPARMAYMLNAKHGGAAASLAFREAMKKVNPTYKAPTA